jgi:hypothetical protein
MKKTILLIIILTLASCERQSGRRVVGQEQKLYIIEYVDEDVDDIKEIRFATRYSASQYRNTLDSLNMWSRLYSEPINKTIK